MGSRCYTHAHHPKLRHRQVVSHSVNGIPSMKNRRSTGTTGREVNQETPLLQLTFPRVPEFLNCGCGADKKRVT